MKPKAYLHKDGNVSLTMYNLNPEYTEFMKQYEDWELRREVKNGKTTKAWIESPQGKKQSLELQGSL